MNAKDLKYFKQILLEKRQEILRREGLLELNDTENVDQDMDAGDSSYATHLADVGSDTMLREESAYLSARIRKFLHHLDEALARVESGDYGICVRCGQEIPRERLEAVPHTRYCVPCKNREGEALSG